MQSPNIPSGSRVLVFQPDYVAGAIGIILGREEVVEATSTDRWLVQIVAEDMIVSLTYDEFRILDAPEG